MTLKYAIDCEMVGCVNGNCLARISIVNQFGCHVLDEYVKPTAVVTDYKNIATDIKKKHLENGSDIANVRRKVRDLIKGCILIGHFLKFDLGALNLNHPENKQRDLALYEPFMMVKYFFILNFKENYRDSIMISQTDFNCSRIKKNSGGIYSFTLFPHSRRSKYCVFYFS